MSTETTARPSADARCTDRDRAIAEYAAAAELFRRAWLAIPDAALAFLPDGDDYALGGLALHVADTLDGYAAVAAAMAVRRPDESFAAPGHPDRDEWWTATVHDGPGAGERGLSLERLDAASDGFVAALEALPADEFGQAWQIVYEGSADAYPTRPADLLDWVREHAIDHTRQVAELQLAWADRERGRVTQEAVERFGRAWNDHDLEGVLALVTDDCIFEDTEPAPDGVRVVGREGLRAAWGGVVGDVRTRFEVEETLVCGDRCVQRWRYSWGDGHVRGIDLFRVRDGLVAEKLSYVKG